MFSQAVSSLEEALITDDRAVKKALVDCLFTAFLLLLWSLYIYVLVPVLFRDGLFPPDTSTYWLVLIVLLLVGLRVLSRYVFARRMAKQRVVALAGHWKATFPSASQQLLSVPYTLVVDSRARFVCVAVVVLLLLAVLPIALQFWIATIFGALMVISFSPLVWLAAGGLAGLLLATFFLFRDRLVMRLEITSDGLTSTYLGERNTLSWAQMRAFARSTRGSTEIYELSGFDAPGNLRVVRWRWRLNKPWLLYLRPSMTREAYADWPDQFAQLIATKANLPQFNFNARLAPDTDTPPSEVHP
jgi:hypothetical protein